jgi:hypothetical protein
MPQRRLAGLERKKRGRERNSRPRFVGEKNLFLNCRIYLQAGAAIILLEFGGTP